MDSPITSFHATGLFLVEKLWTHINQRLERHLLRKARLGTLVYTPAPLFTVVDKTVDRLMLEEKLVALRFNGQTMLITPKMKANFKETKCL